jgi:hypothetical protein
VPEEQLRQGNGQSLFVRFLQQLLIMLALQANINNTYGACCNEMDLWEANGQAQALTPHPCNATGTKLCTGTACSNDLAAGTCDQGGCDFNPYRMGQHDFYGPGKTIDTTKPFTVITQFITQDGTDTGDLVTIWRMYKQNGKLYQTRTSQQHSVLVLLLTLSFSQCQRHRHAQLLQLHQHAVL